MSAGLLGALCALAIALIIAFPLGDALRKYPVVFYLIALAIVCVYEFVVVIGNVNATKVRFLTYIMQKGYLASFLIAIVMYIGVLDQGTPLRARLEPIRGPLSILSFILMMGHIFTYLPNYLPMLGQVFRNHSNVAVGLVIALLLTALFVVLGVTSFKFVRVRMDDTVWKRIQRSAYVMVGLLAVHILFVLGRSAVSSGFNLATVNVIIYGVIIGLYAVLRVRKYLRDRSSATGSVGEVALTE